MYILGKSISDRQRHTPGLDDPELPQKYPISLYESVLIPLTASRNVELRLHTN